MRRHKWHAVPGMGGSRMRGLRPWRVSAAVLHTRGGLGGLACTAAGLRGHRPGNGCRRPNLRAEPPPLGQGRTPWAADPSLPIDTVAAGPVWAGSAGMLPGFYEPIVHLP